MKNVFYLSGFGYNKRVEKKGKCEDNSMYISTKYLHVFLDIGDALLSSGAEILRVEDTLNRMGYACGATQMNVFVITSSIVITMEFPEENVRTQTRRIRKTGGNDFEKLEKLNHLRVLPQLSVSTLLV